MMIYAYHIAQTATPINDRRAGTIRIGSDNPEPITINRGWDSVIYFAFRQYNQRPFNVLGYSVIARIYNNENTQVWNGTLIPDALNSSSATLIFSKQDTLTLQAGLYSLVLEYVDELGKTRLMHTTRSLPRFVLRVNDQTTVTLNN